MKAPKMILFDYGNTIITEKIFGFEKGNQALLDLAVRNPRHIQIQELQEKADEVISGISKRMGCENRFYQPFELSWVSINRYLYEYFNIEFDKSYEELEWIYWNHATSARPSEHIEELLAYLDQKKIRTGIISNIMLSGNSLKRRIHEVLPENHFEFVLASSDYLYRKPEKEIFEIALIKAGLKAEEVWFCGDNFICDIEGAFRAGLAPFWYKKNNLFSESVHTLSKENYIEINDWLELISIIKKMGG